MSGEREKRSTRTLAPGEGRVEMVMNDMTDDGKWGAEIAVGKNAPFPDWLSVGEPMQYQTSGSSAWFDMKWGWGWGCVGGNIRLPADHPHYQQTQPQTQPLTAQEHLERLEAFVRKAAAHVSPMAQYSAVRDHLGDEARALVAEMEPVVDGDLVEARELCAVDAIAKYDDPGDSNVTLGSDLAKHYRSGAYDKNSDILLTLAAIKRGRELARGEG